MNGQQRNYVLETYNLDPHQLDRLLEDLRTFMKEDLVLWVQSRHRELQVQGRDNPDIFVTIQREAQQRLFAAPPLTIRQIRRMIYG